MRIDKPYFMQNEEWYFFDSESCSYELTELATKKAVESYVEFYDALESR